MISLRQEIGHLYALLQNRDKWYIDFTCPDVELFQDIAEKAKENADAELSSMSADAIYARYVRWRGGDPYVGKCDHYFRAFINDMVWHLGLNSLRGRERDLYEESIGLNINFL
jgi:hypothetical protein